MTGDLDSVKPGGGTGRAYHHGGLRAALIAAALDIVEEVGPDAFSLRATARRAGVSAAAPAHHFRDTRDLLTAIATIGFVEFGDMLEAAVEPDRRATIIAQSHAYLRFALARPGLFRLMWRRETLEVDDPAFVAAAQRAFAISDRVVRGDQVKTALTSEASIALTIACWSMVHGFVALVIDGAFFAHALEAPGALDVMLDATLNHLNLDPAHHMTVPARELSESSSAVTQSRAQAPVVAASRAAISATRTP